MPSIRLAVAIRDVFLDKATTISQSSRAQGKDCEPGRDSIAFQIALLHQLQDAAEGGNSLVEHRE